jgi:hypothetical protein
LFYLFGLLFVIGAQINAFFFDNIQPLPSGLGTCLSESTDREHIQLIDEHFQVDNITVEGYNTHNQQG